eukprot:9504011-Pyramimonas_sp.AAC.2
MTQTPLKGKVELKAGDTSWQGGKSKKGAVDGKLKKKLAPLSKVQGGGVAKKPTGAAFLKGLNVQAAAGAGGRPGKKAKAKRPSVMARKAEQTRQKDLGRH